MPSGASVKSLPLKVGDHISIVEAIIGHRTIERDLHPRIIIEAPIVKADAVVRAVKAPASDKNGTIISTLIRHASETFGSKRVAAEWFHIECGALNNETPAAFLKKTGNVAEIERILNCIDYGMIA